MTGFVEDAPGHLMMSDIQLMSSRSGRRQGPQMNLINGSMHPAVGRASKGGIKSCWSIRKYFMEEALFEVGLEKYGG